MVEGKRLALCDEEPESFENGAIQLALMSMPITCTDYFSIASAFATSWIHGHHEGWMNKIGSDVGWISHWCWSQQSIPSTCRSDMPTQRVIFHTHRKVCLFRIDSPQGLFRRNKNVLGGSQHLSHSPLHQTIQTTSTKGKETYVHTSKPSHPP